MSVTRDADKPAFAPIFLATAALEPAKRATPLAPREAKPPTASGKSSCAASTRMYSEKNVAGCSAIAPPIAFIFANARSCQGASGSVSTAIIVCISARASLYAGVLASSPRPVNVSANLPSAVSGGAIPKSATTPLNVVSAPPVALAMLAAVLIEVSVPVSL